jgi:hypothetical protein
VTPVGWLDLGSGVSGDMLLGAVAGVPLDTCRGPRAPRPAYRPARRGGQACWAGCGPRARRRPRGGSAIPCAGQGAGVTRAPGRSAADPRRRSSPRSPGLRHPCAVSSSTTSTSTRSGPRRHRRPRRCLCRLRGRDLDRLVASRVALAGRCARTARGRLPVSGPAVLQVLADAAAPGHGGPDGEEVATPTGATLEVSLAAAFGMRLLPPSATDTGAGGRDPGHRTNMVRLVVGQDPSRTSTEILRGPARRRPC